MISIKTRAICILSNQKKLVSTFSDSLPNLYSTQIYHYTQHMTWSDYKIDLTSHRRQMTEILFLLRFILMLFVIFIIIFNTWYLTIRVHPGQSIRGPNTETCNHSDSINLQCMLLDCRRKLEHLEEPTLRESMQTTHGNAPRPIQQANPGHRCEANHCT